MFCKKCGKLLEEELDICTECSENPNKVIKEAVNYSMYDNIDEIKTRAEPKQEIEEQRKIQEKIKKENKESKSENEINDKMNWPLLGFFISIIAFFIGIVENIEWLKHSLTCALVFISIAKVKYPKDKLTDITFKIVIALIALSIIFSILFFMWLIWACERSLATCSG